MQLTREEITAELSRRGDIWPEKFVDFLKFGWIEDAHRGVIPFEVWPHLIERAEAWDSGEDEIVLKGRQTGMSWLAAFKARHVAREEGRRVLVISMGQTYAYEFLAKVKFIDEHLPSELYQKPLTDNAGELSWEGGGTVTALPSTKEAGRGFTGTLAIIDEGAFHPYAADNYKAYRSTIADGGQLLIISTANGRTGWYHDVWMDSVAGLNDYNHAFIPWNARPGRNEDWYEREKRAFKGLPAEFNQENPSTAEEAFVSLTGLVYPMFSEERHVKDDPCTWEECLYRYAGIDLGGGDPTAMSAWGVYKNKDSQYRFHKFAEYHKPGGAPGLEELADWLILWHRKAPFATVEGDAVPGADIINESLRGVYGLPMRRTFSTRWEGLGLVAQWLNNDWVSYGSVPETIHEFYSYRWLTRIDSNSKDRYATATPHDHHGDQLDADRRTLYGMYMDLINEAGGEETLAFTGVDW